MSNMSTIIQLPDGHSAVLKDDTDLTNKEVKNLRRAARVAMGIAQRLQSIGFDENDPSTWTAFTEMTDEEADTIDLFQRQCVVTRLRSWTLGQPMPATVDEVDDLPRPIYVALTVAAININLSDEFGMDGAADPKAVTEG
jgi:hypothetical protein